MMHPLRFRDRARSLALALALAATAAAPTVPAQEAGPQVGDLAPPFSLPGSDGRQHRLSDHLGRRPVVIAWFPKAFTKA